MRRSISSVTSALSTAPNCAMSARFMRVFTVNPPLESSRSATVRPTSVSDPPLRMALRLFVLRSWVFFLA
jgi:hypothetical protein